MATITLDYDARNAQAKKAMEFILSMGIFKTIEKTAVTKRSLSTKKERIDKIFDKYLIDLSNFKFDRDEANNYE